MNYRTLAVFLITALLLSSCNRFQNKKTSAANPLLCNWKIDSIASAKDSGSFGALLLAMSIDDSAAYDYQFTEDSVIFYAKGMPPSKAAYKYIDTSNQLYITETEKDTFKMLSINDSFMQLSGKDSTSIFLKKR